MPLVENLEEAAQEPQDNFVIDGGEEPQEQNVEAAPNTESATVEEESPSVEVKEPTDNFQSRINKVTADKYAEKRRADDLQAKLDAYNNAPKAEIKKPTLEDHDYDDDANNAIQAAFDERVVKLGKQDFIEKMGSVPILPKGVADALVELDNGPELIYHLGTHLDLADSLVSMTPAAAMMEIGKMSVNMSATKQVKTSAAPEPIQTLRAGSAISKERGPVGATYD